MDDIIDFIDCDNCPAYLNICDGGEPMDWYCKSFWDKLKIYIDKKIEEDKQNG